MGGYESSQHGYEEEPSIPALWNSYRSSAVGLRLVCFYFILTVSLTFFIMIVYMWVLPVNLCPRLLSVLVFLSLLRMTRSHEDRE